MKSVSGYTPTKHQAGLAAPLAKTLLPITDENEMLQTAIEHVCRALSTPLGKILEHETLQDYLIVRAAYGWQDGGLSDVRVSSGTASIAGYTLRNSQPVIFEDLPGTRRFTDAMVLRRNGVVSTIAVTLMIGERAFGVLSVHDVQRRKFSTADLQFIGAAAEAISSRLEALSKAAVAVT